MNDNNNVEYVTFVLNKEHPLCKQIMDRLPELMMNKDLVYISHGDVSDEIQSLEEKIEELESNKF